MTSTTDSKTDRIRELNDTFRRTFVGGAELVFGGAVFAYLIGVTQRSISSTAAFPCAP